MTNIVDEVNSGEQGAQITIEEISPEETVNVNKYSQNIYNQNSKSVNQNDTITINSKSADQYEVNNNNKRSTSDDS